MLYPARALPNTKVENDILMPVDALSLRLSLYAFVQNYFPFPPSPLLSLSLFSFLSHLFHFSLSFIWLARREKLTSLLKLKYADFSRGVGRNEWLPTEREGIKQKRADQRGEN